MGIINTFSAVLAFHEITMLDLIRYMKPGIFIITNTEGQKFQIYNSRNMSNTLVEILNQVHRNEQGEMLDDIRNKKAKVITLHFTEGLGEAERKLTKQNSVNELLSYNMKFYKEPKKKYEVKYSVKQDVVSINGTSKYAFVVYLQNTRKDKFPVGIFDSKDEKDAFLANYYNNVEYISEIVYACNDLTKQHFEKMHKRMKYIPKKDYNKISYDQLRNTLNES